MKSTAKTSKPKPNHRSKNTGPGRATGIIPTDAEYQKRIRQVANLISSGYHRSQIVEAMCSQYGVAWQSVQSWLSRARELLMEELGKPKEEHRADVLREYQRILGEKDARRGDKLGALKGKREMLGLDAPRRTEISGPDGGVIKVEQKEKGNFDSEAYDRICADFFGVHKADGNGQPVHSARPDAEAGPVPGGNGE